MRTLKIMLCSVIVIIAFACTEEETNVQKYYEGGWTIKTSGAQIDTVSEFTVNADGDFSYILNYGMANHVVVGQIKETGELRADIIINDLLVGASLGRLILDGTGSGEYTIVNREFTWTATKK